MTPQRLPEALSDILDKDEDENPDGDEIPEIPETVEKPRSILVLAERLLLVMRFDNRAEANFSIDAFRALYM